MGIHIVPQPYAAIFSSYISLHTKRMDDGYTTHSGCPVIEGDKKLVTQWLRHGVDEYHSWHDHSAMGNPIPEYRPNTCNNPNYTIEEEPDWLEEDFDDDDDDESCSIALG